jgi:hypothetical protein
MMKSLKVSLSALAILLGLGSALLTSAAPHFSNKTWGRDPLTGVYTEVTGQHQGSDYTCKSAITVCTAVYPATQNPNADPSNPISTVLGDFSN